MRPAKFAFLEHDRPFLAFAHRGGGVEYVENSLTAFQACAAMGYRYFETDVQLTRDGVLVVFHDDRLDPLTDLKGPVSAHDWSDISKVRVRGLEPVPTLEELLSSFPQIKINIDPKSDATVEPLAKILKQAGAVERVCVGSFSDRRIAGLRELLGPGLCTSPGPKGVTRLWLGSKGLPLPRGAEGCAQVPVTQYGLTLVNERFVRHCHRQQVQVHVWTIDEEAEMERLIGLGVDGLMTDQPSRLKALLIRRGLW